MPWGTSGRRRTLPADWPKRRARILRRDDYRCTALLITGERCNWHATDVDHIKPYSLGGTDDDSNLTSLCRWHHARKSSAEGRMAQRPRLRQVRDRKPHPSEL